MAHRLPPAGIKSQKTEEFRLYKVRPVLADVQPAPTTEVCCCRGSLSITCPELQHYCARGNTHKPECCDAGYPTQACAHLLPRAGKPSSQSDVFRFYLVRPGPCPERNKLPVKAAENTDPCPLNCCPCPCCPRRRTCPCCKCQTTECSENTRSSDHPVQKKAVCCCQVCACKCQSNKKKRGARKKDGDG